MTASQKPALTSFDRQAEPMPRLSTTEPAPSPAKTAGEAAVKKAGKRELILKLVETVKAL
jgi:hypothetical protein